VWDSLCFNPNARPLLEKYPERIHWDSCASNPALIDLIEKNVNKIESIMLSRNPAIFTYDYTRRRPFTEELMQNRFHPRNLDKFEAWGF
jgi:hypothetical protein